MINRSSYELIQASGVVFGTSGTRGLVERFTDEVCAAFSIAFLSVMREQRELGRRWAAEHQHDALLPASMKVLKQL